MSNDLQTASEEAVVAALEAFITKMEDAAPNLYDRNYISFFEENPSPKNYGETADADGKAAFEAHLGQPFEDLLQNMEGALWRGEEESPYTGKPLGITYPYFSAETLVERAQMAREEWERALPDERRAALVLALKNFEARFFEVAHATMHTTGQGFMMAFQAAGPHAADRATESLLIGYDAITQNAVPHLWEKNMGKFSLKLEKEWHTYPYGLSLAIGCSTFPTWNTLPGVFASLMTGSPVIVKPHPKAVLPLAIAVACIQDALDVCGFEPEVCQLAADTSDAPLAKQLAEHDLIKIIDYTGGSAFGDYLETLPGKILFTEKSGINAAIVHSVQNLDETLNNLAFSICLYSGQMCTAPHHILIPAVGVETPEGIVPFDEVAARYAAAVDALAQNPKAGPFVLGAIQNKVTLERLGLLKGKGKELLAAKDVAHPQFEGARVLSPLVLEADESQYEEIAHEIFGPAVLVVKCADLDSALEMARRMAIEKGALSGAVYVTDEDLEEEIAYALNSAGIPVSFNLTGPIYMNQNAAFSDYHVTGGNPAGNGSIGDPSFVLRRFFRVGNKFGNLRGRND